MMMYIFDNYIMEFYILKHHKSEDSLTDYSARNDPAWSQAPCFVLQQVYTVSTVSMLNPSQIMGILESLSTVDMELISVL